MRQDYTVSVNHALSETVRKNSTTKKLEIDGDTAQQSGGAYFIFRHPVILM